MQVCGVICEYNPFHNGHEYHLKTAKEVTKSDYIVCVMSGSFMQRGTPAMLDKWTRAKMALHCGADLVLELPFVFSAREAEGFAHGGISILNSTGVVTSVCFGSELKDGALIERIAATLNNESTEFKALITAGLTSGKSYPRAQGHALEKTLSLPEGSMDLPNLSLAIEYMRSLIRTNSTIVPHIIQRTNSYNSTHLGKVASATAIRHAITKRDTTSALGAIPESLHEILLEALNKTELNAYELSNILLFKLRNMERNELSSIYGMKEGIEYSVQRLAREATSYEDLLTKLKSKRYTHARLSRLLTHSLLGLTSNFIESHPNPEYIRVLGFKKSSVRLLKEIKEKASLPIITDLPKFYKENPNEMLGFDLKAQDAWGLLTKDDRFRRGGADFYEKVVVV